MDRAVDGGEGQPGPELVPGGSCGVHSWIEGVSGDGRRVSWFAPQNQGGGRRLKTPSRGGTGVGLGTDGGDGGRRRLGPRCGRGGDGCRAASRAVRRPRRERRLGPRRGGGILSAHGFWRYSQYHPSIGLSRTHQNLSRIMNGTWHHRRGCVESKQSPCSATVVRWTMMYLSGFPLQAFQCVRSVRGYCGHPARWL